jgi:hypothetical protein
MRRLVRDFGERLKVSGGVGLFYFAGHGVQVRGENFLVSTDSDIRNEDEVADDSINANVILEKMQSAGNRMNLIILDACRNNPFVNKSRSAVSGLATMNAPSGSLVAYSTAPGSVASDGTGKNGLYTEHLAKVIRQPGLPVEEVFKQVRSAVRRDSHNKQTPWENTALEGQFFFKSQSQTAASSSPSLDPVRANVPESSGMELALWDSVKGAMSVLEFQAYLNRFPNGVFSDVAKARIASIDVAASGRVKTDAAQKASPVEAAKLAVQKSASEPQKAGYLDFVELAANLKAQNTKSEGLAMPSNKVEQVALNAAAPTNTAWGTGDRVGTLLVKDTLTGLVKYESVTVTSADAERIVFSTGDMVGKDGTVLQVRVGSAILRIESGALWTLPLKANTSGSAKVKRIDVGYNAPGTMDWKVIAANDGKMRFDVDVSYYIEGYGAGKAIGLGQWTGFYQKEQLLPDEFSVNIRGGNGGGVYMNLFSAELKR